MEDRVIADGHVHATHGGFCLFDPVALKPLFAPGEYEWDRHGGDEATGRRIRDHEDQAARSCHLLSWDSNACGFHGGRILVRDFHTSESGVRVHTGFFHVVSGFLRVAETADAWGHVAGMKMDGVGLNVELPPGVYRLRLVEMVAVSDGDVDEADLEEFESIPKGGPLKALLWLQDVVERAIEKEEDEGPSPPIYLIEFERTPLASPPTPGPTEWIWMSG